MARRLVTRAPRSREAKDGMRQSDSTGDEVACRRGNLHLSNLFVRHFPVEPSPPKPAELRRSRCRERASSSGRRKPLTKSHSSCAWIADFFISPPLLRTVLPCMLQCTSIQTDQELVVRTISPLHVGPLWGKGGQVVHVGVFPIPQEVRCGVGIRPNPPFAMLRAFPPILRSPLT